MVYFKVAKDRVRPVRLPGPKLVRSYSHHVMHHDDRIDRIGPLPHPSFNHPGSSQAALAPPGPAGLALRRHWQPQAASLHSLEP